MTLTTDEVPALAGTRVTREAVIERIVAESGYTPAEAEAAIVWLQSVLNAARAKGYATQYPSDEELQTPQYQVVDAIMSHGAVAAPGSAHAMVQALLLNPVLDENNLTHSESEDFGDGSPTFCQFRVGLRIGV